MGLRATSVATWRTRRDTDRRFRRLQRERAAVLQALVDAADYRSLKAFYRSNPERRGEEVTLGRVVDGEFRFAVSWLPRTAEVVAFVVGWANDDAHPAIIAGAVDLGPWPVITTAEAPDLVYVLGRSPSADDAQRGVDGAPDLEAVRGALGGPRTPDEPLRGLITL